MSLLCYISTFKLQPDFFQTTTCLSNDCFYKFHPTQWIHHNFQPNWGDSCASASKCKRWVTVKNAIKLSTAISKIPCKYLIFQKVITRFFYVQHKRCDSTEIGPAMDQNLDHPLGKNPASHDSDPSSPWDPG